MNKISLFLDSGAFSAWSSGAEINLQEYIQFIKDNEKYIDVYANLDVIGSPEKTWGNQKKMERAGLIPLPVYHFGEDLKWLKLMLSSEYDYVAFGGTAGGTIRRADIMAHFDRSFLYMMDNGFGNKVKVHGFGVTSHQLLIRYPWYSVDSTSWVVTSRLGGIFLPHWSGEDWDYISPPGKIAVSNKSTARDMGDHITTCSPIIRRRVVDYLDHLGLELGRSVFREESAKYELKENERWAGKVQKNGQRQVEKIIVFGVSNRYQDRDIACIKYYLGLEKALPEWPWPFKVKRRGMM